jgi:hypothetical protein
MIELIRIPAPHVQARQEHLNDPAMRARWADHPEMLSLTSEEEKYQHAYRTPDGRWLIQRAYGACGGGWHVIDTSGRYVCTSCRSNRDGHATIVRTLTAAKAFVAEWSA